MRATKAEVCRIFIVTESRGRRCNLKYSSNLPKRPTHAWYLNDLDDNACLMPCPLNKAATEFGLSRSEALLKTELMARVWQAHAAVCEEIGTCLSSNADDRTKLRAAHLAYRQALRSLERFTEEATSKQREVFLNKPAAWRSTPDAEAIEFWITAYASFSSALADLPVLSDLDYPPEHILTAFEELPDCP